MARRPRARAPRRALRACRLHAAARAAAAGAIATPHSCTPGSFRRVRPRCERSPPIRVTWVRRSASSAFSTPGARRWSGIRTCTASCRPAACHPITSGGFARSTLASSSPSPSSVGSFAGSLWRRFDTPMRVATSNSRAPLKTSAIRRTGTSSSMPFSRPTGSSTRNPPSVGRQPCCGTGALHPSRRHQQPPLDRLRRRACDLSVEGLRARQSVAHDDAHRDGVSPALRPACAATWLRPYSTVWLPRQRVSHGAARARSAPAPTGSATRAPVLDTARLALSAMWRTDGHRPDSLRAPADHRHPRLRHLMNVQPHPDRRLRQRARSHLRRGVPRCVAPAVTSAAAPGRSTDRVRTAAATHRRPSIDDTSCSGSRFQLHSRPRAAASSSLVIESARLQYRARVVLVECRALALPVSGRSEGLHYFQPEQHLG